MEKVGTAGGAEINALILSGRVSDVLRFGNPFAVQPISHVPCMLFEYMMPESRECAIEVLLGKLPTKGKLPFGVERNEIASDKALR